MRLFSFSANAGLTHALPSFTAVPDSRPAAGRIPLLFGREGMRSYLTNPLPRDIQESAR